MMDNLLQEVSDITEFNDISEYMQDENLDAALAMIIKLIMKPDIPPAAASITIIQLQAISAKFSVLARYYTTFEKGTEASKKKNTYYTLADAIDKLVAALKYSVK
jgi:hypothetical protein